MNKKAPSGFLLNHLFENLQNHYRIDSIWHQQVYFSANDSTKQLARYKLIESAADYHRLFELDKPLRRIINRGDRAFQIEKKTLLHSQKFLWAVPNRKMLKQEIPDKKIRQTKYHFLCRKSVDNFTSNFYHTFGFASEIFSRSIAQIHAKPEPEKNIERLIPHLRKWDIIIQKSPKRLTDKFIPGHFGHAAIYMGDSIFVEGIQCGTVTSNPIHFAEGSSFLLIRLNEISKEKERRLKQLVSGQIGKKYDFNFNNCSPDRLVCTELIYLVFEDIEWNTRKRTGIFTMSPDGIIRTAMANNAFSFPLYFNEEQLIENPSHAFIESLLQLK